MKLSGNFGTPIEIEREKLQDTHINLVGVLNYGCPELWVSYGCVIYGCPELCELWVCDLWVS